MANTAERHTSWRSERRTERGPGGKDAHRNPNFSIDRSNPASAHPYESRHPKPTIMQQFLGTGPGAKDLGTFRHEYNKKYKPKMEALKRGVRRPKTVLKMELRDLRRGEGFDDPLPSLSENPELRSRLRRKKKSIYHDVRELEQRYINDDNPQHMREVDLARKRADNKYKHILEHELDDLTEKFESTEGELIDDRAAAMRRARGEINEGQDTPDIDEAGGR